MTAGLAPFHPTRRLVLAAPILLAGGAFAAADSLAADVETYVGHGVHRTGGKGERRTVRWLLKRLQSLGYQVEAHAFPIRTIRKPGGRLSVAGAAVALFPQWLPEDSALRGKIEGPLLPHDAPAGPSIRFAAKPLPFSSYWVDQHDALVAAVARSGAQALVIASENASGGLFALNRNHAAPRHPIPVALVAARELEAIAAGKGLAARLELDGDPDDAEGFWIAGRRNGEGRPIVLSTPLTGWFHCGAERGPGIALWLKLAAELAAAKHPVLVLGTGGHEIGQIGMKRALAEIAPPPDETGLWVHLGASLGAVRLDQAYGRRSTQSLVALKETRDAARAALLDLMPDFTMGSPLSPGETGQVIGAGYPRVIGLSGHFPTFHTPEDKAEAIDYARLSAIAEAVSRLVRESGA